MGFQNRRLAGDTVCPLPSHQGVNGVLWDGRSPVRTSQPYSQSCSLPACKEGWVRARDLKSAPNICPLPFP